MLTSIAHCTARSVFRARIIELAFSPELRRTSQNIPRWNPFEQYSFSSTLHHLACVSVGEISKKGVVGQYEFGYRSLQASSRKPAHFSRLRDLPLSDFVAW